MSRADGFPIMDVSTDIANDPKFRRIRIDNPAHVAPAFMVYAAVLAESWKAGHRVSVADAWPILLPFDAGIVTSMTKARLLDKRGQITRKAWSGWFDVARKRREMSRERWKRANDKRLAEAASTADMNTNDSGASSPAPRGSNAGHTVLPRRVRSSPPVTSPPVPPVSDSGLPTPERAVGHGSNGTTKPKKVRGFATIGEVDFLQDTIDRRQHEAWQSFGGEWDAFKAAWISRGLKYPPRGTDEDRPSDASPSPRAMLWSILDSRPDDLVRWVREAPRGSVANVIGHVLREWHALREEVGRETAEAVR